jgi:hypothetical protein
VITNSSCVEDGCVGEEDVRLEGNDRGEALVENRPVFDARNANPLVTISCPDPSPPELPPLCSDHISRAGRGPFPHVKSFVKTV